MLTEVQNGQKSSLIFNEAIPNIQMLAQTRDGSRYFHQGGVFGKKIRFLKQSVLRKIKSYRGVIHRENYKTW
jgi:hypothetical protein